MKEGVDYFTRTIKLKWWQVPIYWWRFRFGRYKNHYVRFEKG